MEVHVPPDLGDFRRGQSSCVRHNKYLGPAAKYELTPAGVLELSPNGGHSHIVTRVVL